MPVSEVTMTFERVCRASCSNVIGRCPPVIAGMAAMTVVPRPRLVSRSDFRKPRRVHQHMRYRRAAGFGDVDMVHDVARRQQGVPQACGVRRGAHRRSEGERWGEDDQAKHGGAFGFSE